ncbi:GNS1/SUR4 membrane protein, partial [Gonapodya prolifera JEL478]
LEPILHKLTFAIFGTSHRDFTFTAGQTFLSSDAQVAAGIVTYLSLVFGGKYLMSQREPYKLKTLFFWHNIILVAVSAVLLLLMLEVIVPMFWHHGFFWSICDSRAYGKHLEYLYYFNYLIKWWELLDTMFLVAKKKPLEFLHVYHHAATMLLTFVELKGQTAVQWVPIVLNLFVHVVMYYYYAWTSVGKKFWWKRHLTTLQITQFIIDIFVIYLVMWTHMSASRDWPVWHLGDCYGEEFAGFVGMGIISSYLYLFVVLFVETY